MMSLPKKKPSKEGNKKTIQGRIIVILPFLFCFSYLSCAHVGQSPTPPAWMTTPDHKQNEICALGSSEPTYYRKDAIQTAADSARAELARTIKVKIESIMIDFQSSKSNYVKSAEISKVTSYTTETVLEKSKIKNYWYDSEGNGPDHRKGMMYALACMKVEFN